jgi:hypothetical protein
MVSAVGIAGVPEADVAVAGDVSADLEAAAFVGSLLPVLDWVEKRLHRMDRSDLDFTVLEPSSGNHRLRAALLPRGDAPSGGNGAGTRSRRSSSSDSATGFKREEAPLTPHLTS